MSVSSDRPALLRPWDGGADRHTPTATRGERKKRRTEMVKPEFLFVEDFRPFLYDSFRETH